MISLGLSFWASLWASLYTPLTTRPFTRPPLHAVERVARPAPLHERMACGRVVAGVNLINPVVPQDFADIIASLTERDGFEEKQRVVAAIDRMSGRQEF